MLTYSTYYDGWEEARYTCPSCGWKGKGKRCTKELFSELFEICCPSCGDKLGIVSLPTLAQSRQNWNKLSAEDKRSVKRIEKFQEEFKARALKTPKQLPAIEGRDLIFIWDFESYRNKQETLIKYGERIIWSEPALWDGRERFKAVAEILKKKYRKRFQDLIPTRSSTLYLYGD